MYDDPNKDNPICLFDMDGTLCDYDGAMEKELIKLRSPGEPDEYGYEYNYSHSHLRARMELIQSKPGWWEYMPQLPLGFEILKIIQTFNFKIHVLTKGPFKVLNAWSEKVKWCRENLPSEISVTITEDKGIVYGKVLVDDYPPYIERWLEHRPRGLVIMPVNKSNKTFKHPQVINYDGSDDAKRETIVRLQLSTEKYF